MSQDDDTLRRKLRQQLQTLQETDTGTDWLPELVEWLVQELLELEFSDFWVLNHTNEMKTVKAIATATGSGSSSPGLVG